MSLHAVITPEAQQRLLEQKRNSTISSVIISTLSIVLLGLTLALYLLPAIEYTAPHLVTYKSHFNDISDTSPPVFQRFFTPTPPSEASNAMPSLLAQTQSSIAIPMVDSISKLEGLNAGEGIGEGDNGLGPGTGGFKSPTGKIIHEQRCSKPERMARLKAGGGKAETEDAVVKALRWMKSTQSTDGSWGKEHKAGMTGLALLSYLGHCEDPSSEEFGESCLRGIVYLLDLGTKNDGRLATNLRDKHWPYEHAIATYALAEAYSFTKKNNTPIPQHQQVLIQAGEWIITQQHSSGGWDYSYDISGKRGGDLSIVAWHIQALKACKVTGLKFSGMTDTVKAALEYVGKRQASNGGFGYTGTTPVGNTGHYSLTGAGLLSYQMWGKGSRSEVRNGARYILEEAKLEYQGANCDLYAHYYHSQAMMQRGGEQWRKYNQMFSDQILLNQNENGAWKKPGGGAKIKAAGATYGNDTPESIHYRTCLCTLMLEVYYRYLPGTSHH